MSGERISPHITKEKLQKFGVPLATMGLFFIASLGAFTRRQRNAIVERDDEECQFPEKHEHKGGLQVHHIIPQRYAKEFDIDPDYPENGITLCEEAHGKVHPDITSAKQNYGRNKNSFADTFAERQRKLKEKEIYWDDSWDRQMATRAVQNTQKKKKKGWKFPKKKA